MPNTNNKSPNTYSFIVNVESKLRHAPGITDAIFSSLICDWYKSFITSNYEDAVLNHAKFVSGSVKKMEGNSSRVKITYKTSLPITAREVRDVKNWLSDPDDDGNHPIKYKGKNYPVFGHASNS
jgi:hypothetical protein